jgi:L-iditol 2-dehydrogenase/galactitol-1-phosphate 5-dehydrogenase
MKALVLESKHKLVFTDVPEPEPFGEKPVLVRVAAVGVCGSDVLRFAKDKAYHYPLIIGHEFSAIVEAVPPGSRYAPGDRVAVFPLLPNYADPLSRIGEYALSSGYDYFGSRRDGAFAERLYVPEANLIPIPDGLPLMHAALVEPAAVSLHGVLKCIPPADGTALVIGFGPIGGFAAQWLRILGFGRVFVAEVDPRKLALAQGLGFETIDASRHDTVDQVHALTGGRGADCAVEAGGLPLTLLQALRSVGVFGQVLLLGDLSADVTLEASLVSSLLRREVRIFGSWNSKITPPGHSEWEMVIRHMSKDLQVQPLISHTPTLEQGVQMFSDMASGSFWYNKVVFTIAPEAIEEAHALRGGQGTAGKE